MNLQRFVRLRGAASARVQLCLNLNQPQCCTTVRQPRNISTSVQKHEGFIKKALGKIPFLDVNKSRIMASGYLLYESVADKVNYIDFFEKLDLPDTFYSWFVVTELHVWMISARAMAEGGEGKLLRNSLVEALWADVNQRVKKLGASNPSIARAQVAELSEQMQAALIAYDEGLQSDDVTLAGALWRRFFQQEDIDPEVLDFMVKYVRKQMRLLDHLTKEQLISAENINWEPLEKSKSV